MQTPATGRPVKRGEDSRLLTGRGLFLNDRSSPDTAHAAFVRSPHAHALILSVDAAAARAVPGVLGVLTGEDYAADGLGVLGCGEGAVRRDGSPMQVPLRPALPADRARHAGEAVAMVVAGTEAIARDAAELVRVDYRPLDAVADTARAQDPATPLVWENCPGNEAFVAGAGDPPGFDRVRAEAAHVVQQRLTNQRVSANSIEPRGAFEIFDAVSGRFTLHAGVHSPHLLRDILAQDVFGLAPARFRIVTGDIGGSFGMRGATYPELVLVLWAARRLARPVKWVATRGEGLVSDDHGRDAISDACMALDSDGRILGLRVALNVNLGAYLAVKGPRAPLNAISLLSGVYRIPVFAWKPRASIPTPTPPLPIAAMGDDRVELRRRNLTGEAEMPYDTGLGWVYDSGAFARSMDIAARRTDLEGHDARRAAWTPMAA